MSDFRHEEGEQRLNEATASIEFAGRESTG